MIKWVAILMLIISMVLPVHSNSGIGDGVYHERDCGIGEAAYHERDFGIGDAAYHEPSK